MARATTAVSQAQDAYAHAALRRLERGEAPSVHRGKAALRAALDVNPLTWPPRAPARAAPQPRGTPRAGAASLDSLVAQVQAAGFTFDASDGVVRLRSAGTAPPHRGAMMKVVGGSAVWLRSGQTGRFSSQKDLVQHPAHGLGRGDLRPQGGGILGEGVGQVLGQAHDEPLRDNNRCRLLALQEGFPVVVGHRHS
jgi:hypothetical protein